jgi:valyl-tRNA synthetase
MVYEGWFLGDLEEGGRVPNSPKRTVPPELQAPEDRWIVSRLQRAIGEVSGHVEAYDFAHAALASYRFVWSELCDWYLEIVKPRLYDGDRTASATLLWVLEQTLALIHPLMPFVSEEIWSYHPARQGHLAVHPFPEVDEALIDQEAEHDIGDAIALVGQLRAWRETAGVAVGSVLSGTYADAGRHEFIERLARFDFSKNVTIKVPAAEAVASVGPVQVLISDEIDPDAVKERIEARRLELRAEVERAEGKLANQGFVDGAPPEVVEEEREKLARYRAELEELQQ